MLLAAVLIVRSGYHPLLVRRREHCFHSLARKKRPSEKHVKSSQRRDDEPVRENLCCSNQGHVRGPTSLTHV